MHAVRLARLGLVVIGAVLIGVGAGVGAGSALASPGDAPADDGHRGWLLGLVLGRGGSDLSLSTAEISASGDWTSGGTVLRGRVGRYLTSELLVTGEYGVWRHHGTVADSVATASSADAGPVDRYLGSGLIALNLYPRLHGFLLRAGLGWGRVWADLPTGASSLRRESSGPMVVMGAAWEIGLERNLSLVAGADAGRIDAGDGLSANFLQFYVAFHLGVRRLLPRELF